MSEKGTEPDIEPRRVNVAEVPKADIPPRAGGAPIDLFGRLPVEVLFVCLFVRVGGVHYAIAMLGWSVERVELHRAGRAVDDGVASTCGHQDRPQA